MAQAPAHSSHCDLISSFSLHQITVLEMTALIIYSTLFIPPPVSSLLPYSLVYMLGTLTPFIRILKRLHIMAFSYSVRKVQLVEVSGNLLKRGAVSCFLGGDCPFMGAGGRSPPLPSLPLHYNTAAAHSFPFIWPLCCKAL